MKLHRLLLLAAVLPSLATAEVSLGVRAGYAFPAGDAYDVTGQGSFKESDLAKGMVPLQLDVAWRFTPSLSAGLYYAYGFGSKGSKLSDLCSTPGASCEAPVIQRFGVAVTGSLQPIGGFVPWAELGGGMEIATFKVKQFAYNAAPLLTADLDGTFRGWNVNLGVGASWSATSHASFGPYLQVDVAQYTVQHVTLAGQGTVAGGGVDSAKTHEWITIGLRGTYSL